MSNRAARAAALEKLRSVKAGKKSYEIVEEEADLYEYVDEEQYTTMVRSRQHAFVTDDDEGLYADDGREIFDEYDDGTETTSSAKGAKKSKKKGNNAKLPPKAESESKNRNIKSMFMSADAGTVGKKRKYDDVHSSAVGSSKEDDILDDILSEISSVRPPPKFQSSHKASIHLQQHVPKMTTANIANHREPASTVHLDTQINDGQIIEPAKSVEEELLSEPMEIPCDEMPPPHSIETQTPAPIPKPPESSFNDDCISQEIFDQCVNTSCLSVNDSVTNTGNTSFSNAQSLPMVEDGDGRQVLRVFVMDAFEEPTKPGVVFLVGKVHLPSENIYQRICVHVSNIDRRVFFLPSVPKEDEEPITFQELFNEVNAVATEHGVLKHRCRKVTKQHVDSFLDPDVPAESEYLEMRYAAEYPILDDTLRGRTFCRLFGTRTSFLETLIVDRRIRGPSWIEISACQTVESPVSWCQLEVGTTLEHISTSVKTSESVQMSCPPVRTACISMKTSSGSGTSTANGGKSSAPIKHEIVALTVLFHGGWQLDSCAPSQPFTEQFTVFTKPTGQLLPYDLNDELGKLEKTKSMKLHSVPNERALLSLFMTRLNKLDPDLIVGFDFIGHSLDIILHKLTQMKIPNWSRVGALRRQHLPRPCSSQSGHLSVSRQAIAGRLLCDARLSARELIHCKSYDLPTLCETLCDRVKPQAGANLTERTTGVAYGSSSELISFVLSNVDDAALVLKIVAKLNAIPLATQISRICGAVLSRTLLGGRAERNEWLLLHAFNQTNSLPPEPPKRGRFHAEVANEDGETATNSKRKPQYTGGLVFEPKRGFYDTFILLLDFNSLYPSIIQEFNICFSTVTVPLMVSDENTAPSNHKTIVAELPEGELVDSLILPDTSTAMGVLPTELRKLVQQRRSVKAQLKSGNLSPDVAAQLDVRQRALKLTANSMYGCLGFSGSRFHARPLAALITAKGRQILGDTRDLVETQLGLEVIYGDTDSIMINTASLNVRDALALAQKVKGEINKRYRLLEIDLDGIYKPMLLLKKKKYAAMSLDLAVANHVAKENVSSSEDMVVPSTKEMKGLDIVRRDWCVLARRVGEIVLDLLLSGRHMDAVVADIGDFLRYASRQVQAKFSDEERATAAKKLIENDATIDVTAMEAYQCPFALSSFVITKSLTKNPQEYNTTTSGQPHVTVALRLNKQGESGGRMLKAGDTVPYIICLDGTQSQATARAYHPKEVATSLYRNDSENSDKEPKLLVDVNYYLAQQLHPVVSRLLEVIPGLDSERVADLLGLDSKQFKAHRKAITHHEVELESLSFLKDNLESRFQHCDRLSIACPKCAGQNIDVDVLQLVKSADSAAVALPSCGSCEFRPLENGQYAVNSLATVIRQKISEYYEMVYRCEDGMTCGWRGRLTALPPVTRDSQLAVCPKCRNAHISPILSSRRLYDQLCCFERACDVSALKHDILDVLSAETVAVCDAMKAVCKQFISRSAFNTVDMGKLFRLLTVKN